MATGCQVLEHQDVILAVIGLVSSALTWMILASAPSHTVSSSAHVLPGSHVRLNGFAAVSGFDGRGVVLVVRTEAERIGYEAPEECTTNARVFCRLLFCGLHLCETEDNRDRRGQHDAEEGLQCCRKIRKRPRKFSLFVVLRTLDTLSTLYPRTARRLHVMRTCTRVPQALVPPLPMYAHALPAGHHHQLFAMRPPSPPIAMACIYI